MQSQKKTQESPIHNQKKLDSLQDNENKKETIFRIIVNNHISSNSRPAYEAEVF